MNEESQGNGNWRKVVLVLAVNVALLAIIGATFYVQDYKYSLPTPRPQNFVPVKPGVVVELPHPDNRPALLCFASPGCGCSRFNQDHLFELASQFGKAVRVIEVVEGKEPGGLSSPGETLLDPTGAWAKKCGIYSTPQAVVLDQHGQIVFSGNFNSTRFCAEKQSQFTRIALEAVVAHQPIPSMPKAATTPYGCVISAHEVVR